jgi:hypothetical protein
VRGWTGHATFQFSSHIGLARSRRASLDSPSQLQQKLATHIFDRLFHDRFGFESEMSGPKLSLLAVLYLTAKERVIEAGFADEIDWQEEVSLEDLDESTFLRESAWVVLSSGFRETVLRGLKDIQILYAFHFDSLPKNERETRTWFLSRSLEFPKRRNESY